MGCSAPGSSVHDISQARILGWIDISHSRGSSQPRDQTCFSALAGGFSTTVLPGKPIELCKFFIYFGYKSLMRFINCTYFLPLSRQPFQFVDGFLFCVETFSFEVIPSVYFCFCCLSFWSQIQMITEACVRDLTACVFF